MISNLVDEMTDYANKNKMPITDPSLMRESMKSAMDSLRETEIRGSRLIDKARKNRIKI